MKKYLFIFLAFATFNLVNAQQKISYNVRFQTKEGTVNPKFNGGIAEFYKFISENLKFGHVDQNLKEIVTMRFTVDQLGTVTDIQTVRDSERSIFKFGKQLTKVLKKSPKWIPGTVNGETSPITLEIDIPIVIRIDHYLDDDSK